MTLRIGVWVAVAGVLAGCGTSSAGGAPTLSAAATHDEPGGSAQGELQLPDVLEVSCHDGGINVGSAGVRAKPDGVHVAVLALPSGGTSVELANVTDDTTSPGWLGSAYSEGSSVLDTVAPGDVLVRCYPNDGPRHFQSADEDPESVRIVVVDEEGVWSAPPSLFCENQNANVIYDYGGSPNSRNDGPPVTLEEAAAVDLAHPVDAIRTYGYKDGSWRWAAATDDGAVVKLGSYQQRVDSWFIQSMSSCAD